MKKTGPSRARPPDPVEEGTFASPPCFMHELEAYYLPQEEADPPAPKPATAGVRTTPVVKERRRG